jgi:hypothetical protein
VARYDPLDPGADPFRPPEIPTLVGCLHCGQEYDSYRIEWRIERDLHGRWHGCWCCPISGCDGRGFGFDILPLDPDYRDERGGWVAEDGAEEGESPDGGATGADEAPGEDEALPW